jgi:hypothetical protein
MKERELEKNPAKKKGNNAMTLAEITTYTFIVLVIIGAPVAVHGAFRLIKNIFKI